MCEVEALPVALPVSEAERDGIRGIALGGGLAFAPTAGPPKLKRIARQRSWDAQRSIARRKRYVERWLAVRLRQR